MFKGFKDFILRGNVVDLAVGIVIGIAFGVVVKSFVDNLLTPIIGMLGGWNFSNLTFTINDSTFKYGVFINDLLAFVLVAAAVYYAVVVPMNRLAERRKAGADPANKDCPECLSEIPFAASKCRFCGSHQVTIVEQAVPAQS
jgi:large conductance mechanosensitive channel